MSKSLLIFGRRESGKTTLARAASYALAADGLVYVYDPAEQWPDPYVLTLPELYDREETNRLVVLRDCDAADVAQIALSVPPCTAVFDEIDLLCSPGHWTSPAAKEICLRGRHKKGPHGKGVGLVITGQRPNSCHTDLRALCDKIAVFYTDYPDDLDIFEGWFRRPGYRDAILGLKPYEFVLWPDGKICKLGLGRERPTERPLSPQAGR